MIYRPRHPYRKTMLWLINYFLFSALINGKHQLIMWCHATHHEVLALLAVSGGNSIACVVFFGLLQLAERKSEESE